jgi:hypothetical protein
VRNDSPAGRGAGSPAPIRSRPAPACWVSRICFSWTVPQTGNGWDGIPTLPLRRRRWCEARDADRAPPHWNRLARCSHRIRRSRLPVCHPFRVDSRASSGTTSARSWNDFPLPDSMTWRCLMSPWVCTTGSSHGTTSRAGPGSSRPDCPAREPRGRGALPSDWRG